MCSYYGVSMIEYIFDKFPVFIVDQEILLRELNPELDKECYYILMNDPKVHRYITEDEVPTSVEDSKNKLIFWHNLFYKKYSMLWAIEKGGVLIGTIGFNYCNTKIGQAEIVYDLISDEWKRGVMSRSMKVVLDFSFNTMHLTRIEAITAIGNVWSENLLRRFDFNLALIRADHRVIRGKYVDTKLYVLEKNI